MRTEICRVPCVGLSAIMVLGMSLAPVRAQETDDTLRGGFARVDITPTRPVTMSGYASRKGLSEGVHDALSARVVALESGEERLVLISTDLIGFHDETAPAIRDAILGSHGLDPSELWLAAIHTHAGPTVVLEPERGHPNNVEYTEWLRARLVQAVGEPLGDMGPVRVGAASGASPVGVNRRELSYDDAGDPRIWLGRNPEGVHDEEVQVVKVDAGAGRAAVLFDYATHSTALGPKNHQISGDVHGLAEQFVERHLGDGVIALAFAGASGDIDPWYRVLPAFETDNGWIPEPVLLGTLLGEEVVHTLRRIEARPVRGPVRSVYTTLQLPSKPHDDSDRAAETPPTPLNVTVARLGEVAFVGLGAEVLIEIGLAIKRASPFETTLVITHCNGAAHYLPPERLYVEGGYEVESSPFGPTAAEHLVRHVVRMLHEL